MKPKGPIKVVKAVVRDNRNDLYHVVDGYDYIYETSDFGSLDVRLPGFFNIFRAELRVGQFIECRLGKIEDGITQVWLQVIERPQNERAGDVMVSYGGQRQFTPVRHDGKIKQEKAA